MKWTVLGGWGFQSEILKPVFGKDSIYVDINKHVKGLFEGDTLKGDWAAGLKEILQIPDASYLAGWSTGAIMALGLAGQIKPSRIVLLSATPSFVNTGGFTCGKEKRSVELMRLNLKRNAQKTVDQFIKTAGGISEPLTYSPEELKYGLLFLEQVCLLPLKTLSFPLHVINAAEDQIVSPEAGKYLSARAGGIYHELPGNHLFFNDQADKVRRIIQNT